MKFHGTICGSAAAVLFLATMAAAHGEDWAEWLGPRRDSVWRESGIVERFPERGLRVGWRAQVGAGYSAPSVAKSRVYVTDRVAGTAEGKPKNPFLDRSQIPGVERVLCFDERTGRQLWKHEYDCPYKLSYPSGPRAMPQVSDGRVYTVGAEGHLRCLDAKTGQVLWGKHYPSDYGTPTQTWGVASAPLLDGDRMYCLVGGAGHTVVALDKKTGKELWRGLEAKEPGYSAPIMVQAGGVRQLVVWDVAAIQGVNPNTGEVYWREAFPTRMGHSIGTPRFDGKRLFISSFFDGSMMLELSESEPRAQVLWRIKGKNENHPEGLHSLMSTPFLEGDMVYGVCGYGQLRGLSATTGDRLWDTLLPTTPDLQPARWATAFLVKHQDRFFIWNEKGDLILARLSVKGYEEISRQNLLEPTNMAGNRPVVWSHPSFANGHVFVRNDKELIAVDLRERSYR